MTELDEQHRKWITDEVIKQIGPITKAVEEVKRQNGEQSTLLGMQVRKIDEVSSRLKGLWGNGSGPPGYLENARAEDKEWKAEMFSTISKLKADVFREEGKEELRKELEEKRIQIEQLTEVKKTHRLNRLQLMIAIGMSFMGAWFLTLVRPLLHVLVGYLVKAVQ